VSREYVAYDSNTTTATSSHGNQRHRRGRRRVRGGPSTSLPFRACLSVRMATSAMPYASNCFVEHQPRRRSEQRQPDDLNSQQLDPEQATDLSTSPSGRSFSLLARHPIALAAAISSPCGSWRSGCSLSGSLAAR
jgi:hypothetical protein